jgi:glucokinase
MSGALYIGIDLGGTNLRAGVVDEAGAVRGRARSASGVADGPTVIVERMLLAVHEAFGRIEEPGGSSGSALLRRIRGVGLGAPGPLSARSGMILETPNFPGWKDVPLAAMLSRRLGWPVRLENDAHAAAWGEFWAGAGRGARDLIALTLGTGVGGAVILDGRLVRGLDETAGHLGHLKLFPPDQPGVRRCPCGASGCLEAYCSAPALVARACEALAAGRASRLAGGAPLTAQAVSEAARAGDALALELLFQTGTWLGAAVAGLANALNPELCVVAGGLSGAGELLLRPLREAVARNALPQPAARLRVVPALLGEDAGVVGAAGLAREWLEHGAPVA